MFKIFKIEKAEKFDYHLPLPPPQTNSQSQKQIIMMEQVSLYTNDCISRMSYKKTRV